MADQESCNDIHLLKRTRISVYVDEALPDILVVTFEFGVKIFKGVLLDSTKKNIPCGIPNINPAFATPKEEDTLYSVNQRFAYTDPANTKKKNVHISTKYKNNKMTVRLRPRQVLCSKCKGICNENSENVTRKRKPPEPTHTPPIKRSANAPITRSVNTELNKKKIDLKRTLIPKAPQELPNALSGNVNKLNIDNNKKVPFVLVTNIAATLCDNVKDTHSLVDHSDSSNSSVHSKASDAKLKRILRKKRSVGSMEDLWDETVLEEGANKNNNLNAQNNANSAEQPLSSTCTNTRTIKICYGPQGEGTVLKIPAQIENLNVDDDLEENINVDELTNKERETHKAARKAMKKARKEAKRKTVVTGSSPDQTSPRYTVGASSPRYTVGSASPRHGLGNNSPRYVTAAILETNTPKKRKHKMKHKKKHREDKDRKHKEGEEEQIKEPCVTQKLSINLKRLSTTAYASQSATEKTEESSSDEQVPDFPQANPPPVMLRINAPTFTSAPGADGVRLLVGDVVWGKIHGFPWWPGKVLTITNDSQAHVAWYGSSTSSLMQCDQLSPYLDNFKVRYNKKKRGPYKEAIRQATLEARVHAEQKGEALVNSPRSIIPVVPPALASPREINVIS